MPLRDVGIALLVIALWSGNYAVSAIGLREIPPLLYTALRFLISGLVLLPFLPRLTKEQLQKLAGLAVVLVIIHMVGLLVAIRLGLNITTCALVAQLGVPFSCMLGVFFLGERIGKWRLLGLCLAFSGTAVVLESPHIQGAELGFAVGLLAALAWAISNLQLKSLGTMPMLHIIAWLSVLATPVLFALSFAFEGAALPILQEAEMITYLALLYSGLVSTIAGYGLWTALIRRHPVSRVAPFVLLIPVFTGALGVAFMGDAVTHALLIGGALTLAGIALVLVRRPTIGV